MTRRRIAVLGAGIMGSSTALFLAQRGLDVALYDAAPVPFMGASRWNEGKIHLGFLYAGDPSLRTAERLLPGGLAFRPLVEELIGCRLQEVTHGDDIYLVHRDSVVDQHAIGSYLDSVASLVASHPAADEYLADVSDARVRSLPRQELQSIANPELVVGGFVVPERSISTRWVADRFVDAIQSTPSIEPRFATRVIGVEGDAGAALSIATPHGTEGPFDAVVNALWEGRPRVDASRGIRRDESLTHRFRLSVFAETSDTLGVPSAVLCLGAFGDVKNYNGREFYISWYPAGLLATGEEVDPPPVPALDREAEASTLERIFDELAEHIPAVHDIRSRASDVRLEGGWVFAKGAGAISDPTSSLHERHRVGITQAGNYFSVDTGKYSIAPWLALQVAERIAPVRSDSA